MNELRIPVGDGEVGASRHGEAGTLVALGHGAGGNRQAALLLDFAERLAAGGRQALLFNFPYSEAGRRYPDRPEVLERAIAAVAAYARQKLGAERLVLGGKSMGGRIASQAVAKGVSAEALVFLGYPLHPPGKPEKLRDAHLGDVASPMLFLQGTRDGFARWDLIEQVTGRLGKAATLHRIEAADHSFRVTKRSGRTAAEVEGELYDTTHAWLSRLSL
jgi:predicted alpha/beta-hydrolase family hydrolase